ncbi:type II toxin-antitoxin system VapB family antitoxin [Nocardia alba]|uniref:VapB protein of antitoxin of type II toxin-antitoxin system n=1 Tax=Nocardia alba TaxID=225051 RepID=A0A4R1G0Q0_9NOCA|nr:type II toxin-antitoxin system VapB family antitoxin [Nocardia alba]TCJ99744.1 VapB protein of antitoxin of type II toxin-antitoxin system [Nocardia alba]
MVVTTVEIPDDLLAEALRLTGLQTKKGVINLAISELVQGYRQREALAQLERMNHNPFMTDEELGGRPTTAS